MGKQLAGGSRRSGWAVALAAGLGMAAVAPAARAEPEADLNQAGCMACHTKDKKLVGPAFKEIAVKNKGQANAVATLADKVRKGGKGVYGQIPMPPNPVEKIGDAELKMAVEWILKQ